MVGIQGQIHVVYTAILGDFLKVKMFKKRSEP